VPQQNSRGGVFCLALSAAHPNQARFMFAKLKQTLADFLSDEQGQDLVEYSLLLVLIGAVAMLYLTGSGIHISSIFSKISLRVEQANQTIPE
jgi:Flp pilus assembly pilin Flp